MQAGGTHSNHDWAGHHSTSSLHHPPASSLVSPQEQVCQSGLVLELAHVSRGCRLERGAQMDDCHAIGKTAWCAMRERGQSACHACIPSPSFFFRDRLPLHQWWGRQGAGFQAKEGSAQDHLCRSSPNSSPSLACKAIQLWSRLNVEVASKS